VRSQISVAKELPVKASDVIENMQVFSINFHFLKCNSFVFVSRSSPVSGMSNMSNDRRLDALFNNVCSFEILWNEMGKNKVV
jgi:hypothetical protein